jgi:predicted permease
MSSSPTPPRSSALYRVLLLLLPAHFRRQYGRVMEETFATTLSAARSRAQRLAVYLHEIADLIRTAVELRVRASWGWLDDVRSASRTVRRQPAFFLFAACTLGLGIGATTAIFSALEALVIERLPVPGAERVVQVFRTLENGMQALPSTEVIAALSEQSDIFEQVVTFATGRPRLTGNGEAVSLNRIEASLELPAFMGITPVLGRTFDPGELAGRGERVVLVSHNIWQNSFSGDRDVIGQSLTLDGEPWTIIGVLPRSAVDPSGAPNPVDLWGPLAQENDDYQMVARLRAGVTLEAASRRAAEIVNRVDPGEGVSATVLPATRQRATRLREPLTILTAAAAMLLLIACVNVSNLLLQRAAIRQHEMAVRSALGARRARVARQLVFESMLLAFVGGVLGVLLAWLSVRVLNALRPVELVELQIVRIDLSVLGFALLAALTVGMLFGIVPAIHGARANATAALGRAPRQGHIVSARFRWTLVAVEMALSFALLVGAQVVLGTLRGLTRRDPGFRPDGVVELRVSLPPWRYGEEPLRRAVLQSIAQRLRQVGGVETVSMATGSPPASMMYMGRLRIEGQPDENRPTFIAGAEVDAEFFPTMGLTLVAGRAFTDHDMSGAEHPVILDEAGARRLFPDGAALGARFRFYDDTVQTVVGIVRGVAAYGFTADRPVAFWPLKTVASHGMTVSRGGDEALGSRVHILVRARDVSPDLLRSLAAVVRAVEPDALYMIEPVSARLRATVARERLTTALLGAFATMATLLAAVGLYGVVAQIVVHRRHEIGVRVALGANAARIRGLVLRSGMVTTVVGVTSGCVLALAGRRFLSSEIFGLEGASPGAFAAAAVIVSGVALLAMWLPAERAARVDPLVSLQSE